MDDTGAVAQILDYIPNINFDNTTTGVSLFETTIRYLGGLISGMYYVKSSMLVYLRYLSID